MPETYAHALVSLVQCGEVTVEVAVKNLSDSLRKTGKLKLLPAILAALKKYEYEDARASSVIEVSSPAISESAKAEARAAGIDTASVVVNESLISGWRARSASKLIDTTGKKFLIEVFQQSIIH
jgi:F0F1-type ATP synthase delta subunit